MQKIGFIKRRGTKYVSLFHRQRERAWSVGSNMRRDAH